MIFRVYDNLPEGKYGHKFLTWMIWVPPWEGQPSILVNLCKSWLHHLNMTVVLTLKMTTRLPGSVICSRSSAAASFNAKPDARGPAGHESPASAAGPSGCKATEKKLVQSPWPVPLGMKHVSDYVFFQVEILMLSNWLALQIQIAFSQRLPDSLLHCATAAKK